MIGGVYTCHGKRGEMICEATRETAQAHANNGTLIVTDRRYLYQSRKLWVTYLYLAYVHMSFQTSLAFGVLYFQSIVSFV